MRSLRSLVAAGVLLAPLGASAAPEGHPLYALVAREQSAGRLAAKAALATAPPPLYSVGLGGASRSTLDCEHAAHDIALDPKTGATSATLDLRVRADGGPLETLAFTLDEGLTIGALSADDRSATFVDAVASPARVVRVTLSPALAAGEETTLHVAYGGTLVCGAAEGGVVCTKGDDFSYFAHQSVFPWVFDPADPASGALDAMTREIVLRVPSGVDVVATGEKVGETESGGAKVSTWSIDRPLSRTLGMYVFAGKLGMTAVPGRAVPTTLVYPKPELPVDEHMSTWSAPVLDFVERVGGAALPFQRSLTLVRLPSSLGDPGTATFGMTLLSESYARAGDLMHEETWAHENSHLFWGIVVPEKDTRESRLMSEGIATLSELDYTWAHHFAGEDRDRYLARRFVPMALDLRTKGKDLPAIQLSPGEQLDGDVGTPLYTIWAYYKTAATLDHLRATIGDDAFAKALAAYVARCSYVGCSPDDFRGVLEETTGAELSTFWSRWVTASTRPTVRVAFTTDASGADLELAKDDARPMTLEMWLTLEDGSLVRRRVALGGKVTRAHVDAPGAVRSVEVNPRHDVLVDAQSSVDGDVDFDGEADGLDLLRCSSHVGQAYDPAHSVGLWVIDQPFDPRCDLNHDLRIDRADLDLLAARFGTLRAP